jgi:serine/threonine protein kinase, bacterial
MLLNSRYRVIKSLGFGGFGETFLAEDTQMPSKRYCVVKLLKPIHNNPQIYQLVKERFQREAAILEDLGGQSEQIPTLYAYFEVNGQFYLVQEYIEGDTLTTIVENFGIKNESAVREILTGILPILEYVHSKGIIHRDIKPDNIILRHRDSKVILIDFGAVRETMGTIMNSQGNPTSSIVIGTPGYMPNEQAAGRAIYSSDLYSLGITAIYLLTGKQPQQLETDSRTGEIIWHLFALNLSPTLKATIDKAIAYHPRDRFPTAKEMLDALRSEVIVQKALPTLPSPPVVPFTIPMTAVPSHRHRTQNGIILASLIVGGLIGTSVIAGIMLTKSSQPLPEQQTVTQTKEAVIASGTPLSQNTPPSQASTLSSQSIPPSQVSTLSLTPISTSFYFIASYALDKSNDALLKVESLKAQGYAEAGMFWIPDYPNLSGKRLFNVYPAKFSDRNLCANFLKGYRKRDPQAYCAFASKDKNAPADRFYSK